MSALIGKGKKKTSTKPGKETLPIEVQVGRLFVVGLPRQGKPAENPKAYSPDRFGGVFLGRTTLGDVDRARQLTHRLRRRPRGAPPRILCTDEEGGLVSNMARLTTPAPSAELLGVVDDEDVTHDVYEGIGSKLRALGFNLVFAPVLDVNSEAGNPVIGTRSFGSDPDRVARHGKAAIEGLHAARIAVAVKHFPGHGATTVDSHQALPTVSASRETLWEREIVPFRQAFALHSPPEMVMVAHVVYPALDKRAPATLSHTILQDVLRKELGFQGVVVSDAMEMKAIADGRSPEKAAIQAIQAGVDLLLYPLDPKMAETAYQGVLRAVRSGKISEERLAEASNRIRGLYRRLRASRWLKRDEAHEHLDLEHEQAFFEPALRGLVVEGNAGVLAQIPRAAGPKIVVLPKSLDDAYPVPVDVAREQLEPAGFTVLETSARPRAEEIARLAARAAKASVVVVGTASRGPMPEETRKLMKELTRRDVIKVGVALLNPQDADQMMTANCRLKTFGFTVPQVWAMCQKLLG